MTEAEREEINKEPVWYCKDCLSLKVMNLTAQECFCDDCGSVDIGQADINDWIEMYEKRYKHKFIEYGKKRSYYVWKRSQDD